MTNVLTLTCRSVGCRITTYQGTHATPLNACPVCQGVGTQTPTEAPRRAALTDDRVLVEPR